MTAGSDLLPNRDRGLPALGWSRGAGTAFGLDQLESRLAEQRTVAENLYAVFARLGEHQAKELKTKICDSSGVLEIDNALTAHDGRSLFIRVDDGDGHAGFAPPIGHGDVNAKLWLPGRELRGVDRAEHSDQGLFARDAIGDDLITNRKRQDTGRYADFHSTPTHGATDPGTPGSRWKRIGPRPHPSVRFAFRHGSRQPRTRIAFRLVPDHNVGGGAKRPRNEKSQ